MGWASGSSLFSEIIRVLKPEIPDLEARKRVYRNLVEVFRNQDWDTLGDCLGKDDAYDAVYDEIYGDDD